MHTLARVADTPSPTRDGLCDVLAITPAEAEQRLGGGNLIGIYLGATSAPTHPTLITTSTITGGDSDAVVAPSQQIAAVIVNDPGVAQTGDGGDAAPAETTANDIIAAGGKAAANFGNVADPREAARIIEDAVAKFGRIDAVTARERVKFAELAPLYGSTPAEAVALTREQFAELSALATWSVAPLDPAEIVLRRCCGGRVVELIDRDGRAALRSGPEMADAAWSLHAFVARVNGLLEIVR